MMMSECLKIWNLCNIVPYTTKLVGGIYITLMESDLSKYSFPFFSFPCALPMTIRRIFACQKLCAPFIELSLCEFCAIWYIFLLV